MSEIKTLKPYVVVRKSICVACRVALSLDHHSDNLGLKSSKIIVNWDFEQSIILSKSSKLDKKNSNSEVLWLGNLYTTAAYSFVLQLYKLGIQLLKM